MYMLIRMPLACLLIMVYTFLYYRLKKRLPTKTSKVFEGMAICAIIHLVAAVVTEYTVNNRSTVPEAFNYIWHLIFLTSITCICGLIYYYLILYVERGTGHQQQISKIALLTVFVISILGELILPIEYIDTPHGSYSLGMKAYSLYVIVIYTMVMLVITIFRYRETIGKEKSNVLLASVVIFVTIAMIQMVRPYMLLTGLAITLIVLGIMVNTEDAHMYISYHTGLYNDLGCREILQELIFTKKPFQVAAYAFLGNNDEIDAAMLSIQEQLPEKIKKVICGTLADNVLVVLPMQSLTGIASLPKDMPTPNNPKGDLKYTVQILNLDCNTSVPLILKALRDFKNRYEANALQRDELTGLLRRAAFIRQVEYLITSEQEFTFLMVDLDDFKSINDTYGHGIGDKVLKCVADILSSALRTSDIICRMGGDEFAIALLNITNADEVCEITDRIRKSLAEMDILPDSQINVLLSIGAKICNKQDRATSFQEIYTEADAALYHAKYNGKNQISFSSDKYSNSCT